METRSLEDRKKILKEHIQTYSYEKLQIFKEQYEFDCEMDSFYYPEHLETSKLLLRLINEEIEVRNYAH